MFDERRPSLIFSKAKKIPKKYISLQKELKERLQTIGHEIHLNEKEDKIVARIRSVTKELNRNNLTRTAAYLEFYKRNPEVDWAFLAHMVSRNTGWNMTDLKGSFLPKLMTKEECDDFYAFLERGNWVIFEDAYPQLLLYEKSKHDQHNYFHLLSFFHVSIFMEVLWSSFLQRSDSEMITLALVVNEQSHLEQAVMRNAHFKKRVLDKIEFKLQDLLSMNQILFPFESDDELVSLRGRTIHQFEDLDSRINIGRYLYALLFDSNHLEDTMHWAVQTAHTGSRMDYWPHLFNLVNEEIPGKKRMHSRFKNGLLKDGEARVYSPLWQYAWKDLSQTPASHAEWFKDTEVLSYLVNLDAEEHELIEKEYFRTLEKLEYTVMAKNAATLF